MHGVEETDPSCIHSAEQLIDYVNEVGFLPLFQNEIPGFSVEEHTVSKYWWTGDAGDPWAWREEIARSGKVAYGKFFARKAGFISLEWLPVFINCRRDGYDFDALWDDEKANLRSKKLMDLFEQNQELYSFEMKKKAGFGKDGEKNFDGVLTDLQMQCYLCVRDFRKRVNRTGQEYGWSVAVYTTPELLWGREAVCSGYCENPEESRIKIYRQILKLYPDTTEKMIRKALGQGINS